MNKKFISVFMMGAATLAPLSTLVSCSDYDDDINNLQAQIDASGVNLKEEVSKLQKLLDECKAAAEKADADLEQAIKNATNDAKGYADIQAEQAKQAAIAAAQAQIAQAIADLENGAISAAQARANEAYTLAEQVSKVANDNKAELAKLANDLKSVNADLEKAIEALQGRMTVAEANIANVKSQAAENKAKLTTLEETINSLKTSNDAAHKALSAKDDELKKLIEDNQKAIEAKLTAEVAAINAKITQINTAIGVLEGRVDALEGRADNAEDRLDNLEEGVDSINGRLDGLDQLLSNVQELVGANTDSIAANKEAIDLINEYINGSLKSKLQTLSEDLQQAKNEIVSINTKLDFLFRNLNNLITGLIFQEDQLDMVQAKVARDAHVPNIDGFTFVEGIRGSDEKTIYFPYKKFEHHATLESGKWNVEKVIGNIYYTINPTDVNFAGQSRVELENSNGHNLSGLLYVSSPQLAERTAPIKRSVNNGLYQSTLTYVGEAKEVENEEFKNSYALYTSYEQYDDKGNKVPKKVYSQYALNIEVKSAGAVDQAKIKAKGASPSGDYVKFDKMSGELHLYPTCNEFGKLNVDAENRGLSKVYRKFIEIVGVKNSNNQTLSGDDLKAAVAAIEGANPGIFRNILTEESSNNIFNVINVAIPDVYGSNKSLVGATIKYRYFLQNYNGSIYHTDYEVMYAKTLFEEKELSIHHKPYQSGSNNTMRKADGSSMASTEATAFKSAVCVTGDAESKLWVNTTKYIEFEAEKKDNQFVKIENIKFYTDDVKSANNVGWTAQNPVQTLNVNNAEKVKFTISDPNKSVPDVLKTMKNMVVEYTPSNLILDKTYTFYLKSLDANGNTISKIPVKFTMEYNTEHAKGFLQPGVLYFTDSNGNPVQGNLTIDMFKNQRYTLTAWCTKEDNGYGKYDISAAFIAPEHQAHGCQMSFELANKASYTDNKGANKDYNPNNTWRLTGASNLLMSVPKKALKPGEEHRYTLNVGVQQFGYPNLWGEKYSYPFDVVFKSPVSYAKVVPNYGVTNEVKNTNFTISYPEGELLINDDKLEVINPADGKELNLFVNSSRSALIKNVTVQLANAGEDAFSVKQVEDDGIRIKCKESSEGSALIDGREVTFDIYLEDQFGNKTKNGSFKVKLKVSGSN